MIRPALTAAAGLRHMAITVKCELCGGDNAYPVKREAGWTMVQCGICGFVYLNPRPDTDMLDRHYQDYLPCSPEDIASWETAAKGIFRRSLDLMERAGMKPPGKLLDIGCAHGCFLQMASERGWTCKGIDLSQSGVSTATARGLDASVSTLYDLNCADNEYDVVTMFYVLEHLPEPTRFMREVHRILKPEGLALLRLPHSTPAVKLLKLLRIPNRLYHLPSHLSDFSPRTAGMLLRKAGFNRIRTMIACVRRQESVSGKLLSGFCYALARALSAITSGRRLMPGVTKTTMAWKDAAL